MGLGIGLFEELIYDGQQLMNGTMLEYRVPRFSDLARKVELKLVQNRDGVGPYGAKGGGEGSVNPIGACLANALYQAAGVRIRSLPLTPERVWKALQEKKAQPPVVQKRSSVPPEPRSRKTLSRKTRTPKRRA
jgi:CO/xanthine dehydrogenase Mo-binding subunit